MLSLLDVAVSESGITHEELLQNFPDHLELTAKK
jgi:hypothetical protein